MGSRTVARSSRTLILGQDWNCTVKLMRSDGATPWVTIGDPLRAQKQPTRPEQVSPAGVQLATTFWFPPSADVRRGDHLYILSLDDDFAWFDPTGKEVLLVDPVFGQHAYLAVDMRGSIR